MAFYICLTCSVLIALSVGTLADYPPLYGGSDITDIHDGCSYDKSVYVSSTEAKLVYAVKESTFSTGSCQLSFRLGDSFGSSSGFRYFVKAEKMALGGTGACLQIYEGLFNTKINEFCGDSVFQLNTSEPYMDIKLVTSRQTSEAAFRLVVTPFSKSCFSTSSTYFQCDNGDCIGRDLVGDGHQNCQDNSDEKDTPVWPCSNMFSCGSSALCIASSWKCDRFQDCPNSLDEEDCVYKCPPTSSYSYGSSDDFQCRDGNGCFSSYKRCSTSSYYDSCSDNTENMDCDECDDSYYGRGDTEFMNGFNGYCWMSRSCVRKDKWCDGYSDCPDGSDEDPFWCHPSIYWYWSPGQLAGLFIGFFSIVAIVVIIVFVVHKTCRKEVG